MKINLFTNRKLLWVTLFAIAMGMVESAVVIYLRELYYPEGFKFPLNPTSPIVAMTELLRELATMIMLLTIGILIGKSKHERFAWFIYSFAFWDISYYLFLYLIIGWPLSFTDLDILFLMPMMWIGPVWAPLLLSALMILLALCILNFSDRSEIAILKMREWLVLILGALTVITAFCKDYYLFVTTHYPNITHIKLFFSKDTITYAAQYVPVSFDVKLFLFGCIFICLGIGIFWVRNRDR